MLGREVGKVQKFTEEMLHEKVKVCFVEGSLGRPMVFFYESLVETMSLPWREALVIKVVISKLYSNTRKATDLVEAC